MSVESLPGTVFLVIAYSFAVVVLGGFLYWSLRELRELQRPR